MVCLPIASLMMASSQMGLFGFLPISRQHVAFFTKKFKNKLNEDLVVFYVSHEIWDGVFKVPNEECQLSLIDKGIWFCVVSTELIIGSFASILTKFVAFLHLFHNHDVNSEFAICTHLKWLMSAWNCSCMFCELLIKKRASSNARFFNAVWPCLNMIRCWVVLRWISISCFQNQVVDVGVCSKYESSCTAYCLWSLVSRNFILVAHFEASKPVQTSIGERFFASQTSVNFVT